LKNPANIVPIIFTLLALAFSQHSIAQQADLPMACVGSTERYGVKGFNGISDFEWTITDPDGNLIPSSDINLLARGDSVDVTWSENLKGGIYTLSVIEHTDYGCTGAPYNVNVVLNSPEIFIPIENNIPDDIGICFGSIDSLKPGTNYINYLWQDGSTNNIYYTGEAGTYRVRLVNSDFSCSYDSTHVVINPLPTVDIGPEDTALFANQTLELDAYDPTFSYYDWNTGAITPSITVDGQSGDQSIWVVVTDVNGCSNSDSIKIHAADYSKLRIPAAFTPNGDGVNDKWEFPAPEEGNDLRGFINDIKVEVFNRWGKQVWNSKGLYKPWDGKDLSGKELPMDSYHYIIVFTVSDKKYEYKGSVTIIR